MTEERYITLVIHTLTRALQLKALLEKHGIPVKLEDLSMPIQMQKKAVRVKIAENRLSLALRITESGDSYSPAEIEREMAGMSGNLLIPVDFSQSSLLACKVAFDIASSFGLHPVLLHTFVGMILPPSSPSPLDNIDADNNIAEIEEAGELEKIGEKGMRDFKKKISALQNQGKLPAIKFSTIVTEGVPEDVIAEYCRQTPPSLVVMATRGIDKKEEELIGSVTAEVLDSCRVPVFTVPENYEFTSLSDIKRMVMFCNLDQHDVLTVDTLMRLLDFPDVEFFLVPVNDRLGNRLESKLSMLKEYLSENYPSAKFSSSIIDRKGFREEFERFIQEKKVDLLIVPNKKTNIFSRIFRPTIAHKCLFERDMPLLAIPV